MQPARAEADDCVTDPCRAAVDQPRSIDDSNAEPGQVELVVGHHAGVLRRLATDELTAGLAAACRHAIDDPGHPLGHDAADREVVEEEERLGAVADDIVGTHRDQVPADPVEPVQAATELDLGADAVGRADQHRLA